MESDYSVYSASLYLPAVLGTLICAATLICVITFTIIAAVKFAKHFKNPDNGYEKFAAAAVFSFLTGAVMVYGMNSGSSIYAESDFSHGSFSKLSDATVAGIVLSCVFLGLSFACKAIMPGKTFTQKKTIVSFTCTLIAILFTVLTVVFSVQSVIRITENSYDIDYTCKCDFLTINQLITPPRTESAVGLPLAAPYTINIIARLVQTSLPVLGGVLLAKRVGGFGKKTSASLGLSIALAALALASLVFTYVSLQLTFNYFDNIPSSSDTTYTLTITAGPIVALIMAVFNLADAIAHKILSNASDAELPENTQFPESIE